MKSEEEEQVEVYHQSKSCYIVSQLTLYFVECVCAYDGDGVSHRHLPFLPEELLCLLLTAFLSFIHANSFCCC